MNPLEEKSVKGGSPLVVMGKRSDSCIEKERKENYWVEKSSIRKSYVRLLPRTEKA
jgi:hypothetical protein